MPDVEPTALAVLIHTDDPLLAEPAATAVEALNRTSRT